MHFLHEFGQHTTEAQFQYLVNHAHGYLAGSSEGQEDGLEARCLGITLPQHEHWQTGRQGPWPDALRETSSGLRDSTLRGQVEG